MDHQWQSNVVRF